MYDTLIRAVETYFDELKVLKRGARGTVTLVRHRDTGKRYIFRCFDGSDEVYVRFADTGKLVRLAREHRVMTNPVLLSELSRLLGEENVVYAR